MNLLMRRWATLYAVGLNALASACSGPGAHRAMEAAKQMALWGALANGLLVLLAVLFRRRAAALVGIVLFVIHPAWTMSPYSGECGGGQSGATFLVAAITLSTLVLDVLKKGRFGSTPS